MTAVMQSSSATIAIVLTMLFSGVINFSSGAAMVIGANVGTTVTILLGAIGGMVSKKQAALSQLIFTVSTAIITLLILPLLTWLVLDLFGFENNLVLGLALFHSIFNIIGVIVFYPFISKIAGFAEKTIPERVVDLSKYIHKTDPSVADAGIEAFRKEIIQQLNYSLKFIHQQFTPTQPANAINYGDLEQYHAEIFEYYTKLVSYEMDESQTEFADKLLRASRNIMNSAKNIYELRDELSILKRETAPDLQRAYQSISGRIKKVYETGILLNREANQPDEIILEIEKLHEQIDREDRDFIKMCSGIISSKEFKKVEVTFLLMMNRVITQSSRMLIFAMKNLLKNRTIEKSD